MMEWGEDSIYWRTEYECEFVESVSNVFNPEKLKACFDDYEVYTPDTLEQGRDYGPQITVGVDIGKSVNSTVITGWRREKPMGDSAGEDIARLIYIEEINARTGGHDIPYQRRRIMEVANLLQAERVIIDATGIGGAIEQDIRMGCIDASIHFFPFVFTGGPKGTKTQVFRDYVSFIQQGRVKVANPDSLPPHQAKLINKWLREHIDLQYTMDVANKTEKIAAPETKHDDYCDSSVIALHATLGMLPAGSAFTSLSLDKNSTIRENSNNMGSYSNRSLFTTRARKPFKNNYKMQGL